MCIRSTIASLLYLYRENTFPLTLAVIEKTGSTYCCSPNFSLEFRIRETLQRWLEQIVFLQGVKLPCQLPELKKRLNDLELWMTIWKKKWQFASVNIANCHFASCQITLSIALISLSNYVMKFLEVINAMEPLVCIQQWSL